MTITAANVTINGFAVAGSLGGGNEGASVFILANNATIANNVISADVNALTGIVVAGGADSAVINANSILSFSVYGAYFNPNSAPGAVTNNTFFGNGEAVIVEAGPSVNNISGNVFTASVTNDIRVSLRTSGTYDLTSIVGQNSYSGGAVEQVNVRTSGDSTVTGTNLNDRIEAATIGTYENMGVGVTFDGGAGNDTLIGGMSSDTLTGGSGNDVINGGDGNDIAVFSGLRASYTTTLNQDGSVTVTGADGSDTLRGVESARFSDGTFQLQNFGSGDDNVVTNDDNQSVSTGSGDDQVTAGNGNNNIATGSGDDTVTAGNGNNTVDAGTGDDSVTTGSGLDVLLGGTGDDRLAAGGSQDFVYGQTGNDVLIGGEGNDFMDGGSGADVLDGGAGIDAASYADSAQGVTASLSRPSINSGDAQQDSYFSIEGLEGSAFADALEGDAGNNVLLGQGGQDFLYGLGGSDALFGGAGNDFLFGGEGQDVLVGGGGQDIFVMQAGGGNDIITDFRVQGAEADFIDFVGLGLSFNDLTITSTNTGQLVSYAGGTTITVDFVGPGSLSQSNFLFDV